MNAKMLCAKPARAFGWTRWIAWYAAARLNATPLDREAMRVLMQRLREIEIIAIPLAAPPIARNRGFIAMLDVPRRLLKPTNRCYRSPLRPDARR